MKEIVKEIKREVVEKNISYEAIDGTIWNDRTMCQEYENNMGVILLSKIKDIVINTSDTFDWFEDSDENAYLVVVPKEETHLNLLNQLWLLFGGNCTDSEKVIFTEKDLNTVILIGHRQYEGKLDWVWFWKFDTIIEQATNNKYKLVKND